MRPIRWVLGVETSCDETALAMVRVGHRMEIRGSVVSSSLDRHRRFGGVVPEIACRAHEEVIHGLAESLLRQTKIRTQQLDAVAVTQGPGLVGALVVGIAFAKSTAAALGCRLIGVHHLAAHLEVAFADRPPSYPYLGLLISGGHTLLVEAAGLGQFQVLGQTRDDAVGEAYDKVAKILGLGYPGGPILDRLAIRGRPEKFPLPRISIKGNPFDFSFSGLKTAVLYGWQKHTPGVRVEDVAASFQHVVVRELVRKTLTAAQARRLRRLVVGGGVSANQGLRRALTSAAAAGGIRVKWPPLAHCTDNAVMIAVLGGRLLQAGWESPWTLGPVPNLQLESLAKGGPTWKQRL